MRILVIGGEHTVTLFKLVGFEGAVVRSRAELIGVLRKALEDKEVGVIMIDSEAVSYAPDEVSKLRIKVKRPIIVEIPSVVKGLPEHVNYLALVRQVIS